MGFKIDQKALKRYQRGMASLRKTALVAGAAILGIGAGIGWLAKKAGEMEQIRVAFETITGSVEKANQVIQDITKFAATTPFQLTELFVGAKQLLAVGVAEDELIQKMSQLGDIASVFGKEKMPMLIRVFGRLKSKGRADLETLNMMIEAGIPIIQEFGKHFGIADTKVFDMLSKGKISLEDFNEVLHNMTKEGGIAYMGMIKQSKTLLGLISNLVDFLEVSAIQMGEEFLPVLKDVATNLLSWLDANKKLIKLKFAEWARKVAKALKGIVDFVGWLIKINDKTGLVTEAFRLLFQALILIKGLQMIRMFSDLAQGLKYLGIQSGVAAMGIKGIAAGLGTVGVILISIKTIFDSIESLISGDRIGGIKWASDLRDIIRDIDEKYLGGWVTKIWNFLSPIQWLVKLLERAGITGAYVKAQVGDPLDFLGEQGRRFAPGAEGAGGGMFPKGKGDISNTMSIDLSIHAPPGADANEIARVTREEIEDLWDRQQRETVNATGAGGY